MRDISPQIILCNGADLPHQRAQCEPLVLEYRDIANSVPNVKLDLPNFVYSVFHLPDRILDFIGDCCLYFLYGSSNFTWE